MAKELTVRQCQVVFVGLHRFSSAGSGRFYIASMRYKRVMLRNLSHFLSE